MRSLPRIGIALLPALLPALLLSLEAAPASSAVPSPVNSAVPDCLVGCPLGDMAFDIIVRDVANNPVANSTVVLDFSLCPEAYICTFGNGPVPYTVDITARTLSMLTDATGLARFPPRMGGGCAANTVRVFADGVMLGQRAFASPDQDGDGFTSNLLTNDHALFYAKVGTTDPTADFDCDADVDIDDQGIFFFHASKSCFGYVDAARRGTWGQVKSYYR